jgi:SAM-dependent methyltransferase
VLDVGCATGNFGAALQELKGCTVVGVDIDEDDLAEVVTNLSEAYVLDISQPGAAEKLGAFDIVIFADVIEHLPNATVTLRAAKELHSRGRDRLSHPQYGACFSETRPLSRSLLLYGARTSRSHLPRFLRSNRGGRCPCERGPNDQLRAARYHGPSGGTDQRAASCDQNTAKGTYSEGPTRFGTRIVTM